MLSSCTINQLTQVIRYGITKKYYSEGCRQINNNNIILCEETLFFNRTGTVAVPYGTVLYFFSDNKILLLLL